MKTLHFSSGWAHRPELAARWYQELEKVGPEIVRIRLNGSPGGSGSAITIGSVEMTRGFAEDWLRYRHKRSVRWTTLISVASLIAAIIAAIGAWRP